MKSYPKKNDTPNRRTRKGMRRGVFEANRKAARLARKARKAAIEKQAEEPTY